MITERKRHLLIGSLAILSVSILILLIWLGTYFPGEIGRIFAVIAGIMWSPVFMEISFCTLGIVLLFGINGYRRSKEPDEYVPLSEIPKHLPETPSDLP